MAANSSPTTQWSALQVLRDDGITTLVRARAPEGGDRCQLIKRMSGPASADKAAHLYTEHEIVTRHRLSCALDFERLEGSGHNIALVYADAPIQPLSKHAAGDWLGWITLAESMVTGLRELHETGLLHLHLRPDAFAVTGQRAWLVDLCQCVRRPREYRELQAPGRESPDLRYVAPETTGRLNRPADYRSDYYSLGAILYHCFTGQPPFDSDDPLDLIYQQLAMAPAPTQSLRADVPQSLEQILQRLLEKDPDRRYQSADELLEHLALARGALEGNLQSNPQALIQPRQHRRPLHASHRLYGRESQIRQLMASFERARTKAPQLTLIKGSSGIGKTALIRETYLPMTRHRAFYIAGKFDQIRSARPYSAWLDGLDKLVDFILAEPQQSLALWRKRLHQTLGSRAGVLGAELPKLGLLLGEMDPPPELPASEAKELFHKTFVEFIRLFSAHDQPLVIFLDDLQWIDNASLQLLEVITQRVQNAPLLLIGAYRDSEVGPNHPLTLTLDTLPEQSQFELTTLSLQPLQQPDLTQLLAEITQRPQSEATPLATEVVRKTGGNPFYIWQLLHNLRTQGAITAAPNGQWEWDLETIARSAKCENLVDVMLERLGALPGRTRELLAWAACLGTDFDLTTLSWLAGEPEPTVYRDLEPALTEEFILPRSRGQLVGETVVTRQLSFFHDRMQEAAYRSLPADQIAPLHHRIGRLLLEKLPPDERERKVVDIVGHLNLASNRLQTPAERLELARLNLASARRAKGSAAFAAALEYLCAGMARLPEGLWQSEPELAFNLYRERAELEYLNSRFEQAEHYCYSAIEHEPDVHRRVDLHHMLVMQYTLRSLYQRAIETARAGLELVEEHLPKEHYHRERDRQLAAIYRWREEHELNELAELPPMSNPRAISAMQLLTALGPPCYRAHPDLWAVVVARQVNLCLEYGVGRGITYSFPALGGLLTHVGRGNGRHCRNLYDVTRQLMSKDPADDSVGYLMMGSSLRHWFAPLASASQDYLAAYKTGQSSGNLQYAVYGFGHNTYCRFFQGEPLDELIPDTINCLSYSRQRGNLWGIDLMTGALRLFSELHGGWNGESWPHKNESEADYLARCEAHGNLQALCIYHIMRAACALLADDLERAEDSIHQAQQRLDSVSVQGLLPVTQFYVLRVLVQFRLGRLNPRTLAQTAERYRHWSRHAPENFEHWHLLTEALELSQQRDTDGALEAFSSARDAVAGQECWLARALVYQTIGHYWRGRAQTDFADLFDNLQRRALHQGRARALLPAAVESQTPEIATVIRIAQTLSAHCELDQLVPEILHHVARHTGAQRLALLLAQQGELQLVMEHRLGERHYHEPPLALSDCPRLPQSIIRYVSRTQTTQRFTMGEIAHNLLLGNDPYLRGRAERDHHEGSFWCVPLTYLGELLGVLYLEHELSAQAFDEQQAPLVEFLAAQAAICVRNLDLLDQLDKESRARREAERKISSVDTEITMHRDMETTLKRLASTDELTQLANRRMLIDHLEGQWQHLQNGGAHSAQLLMIDIDYFKAINDRHGHGAGDQILQALAQVFNDQLRPFDLAARLGGEEFAVLLTDADAERAMNVAERLRQCVENTPYRYQQADIHYTISVGVTSLAPSDPSHDSALLRADRALYRAKREGRNRVCWLGGDPG